MHLDVGWADCDIVNMVEVGDRLVPATIEVTFPGADGQPSLTMTIDSTSGVPRCTDLRIRAAADGREVRTTDLRAVTLEDWLEIIVSAAADPIISREGGTITTASRELSDAEQRESLSTIRKARRSARRKVTPDLLQRVANVYQQHADDRPVVAVIDAFGVPRRTASRYVALAREQGYLAARGEV
jgi:hypothetical protein